MNIDYTKLLPAQLRSTRWADILTVVGGLLEDVKVADIDIIKTQNIIMSMTDEQLISFALNFGYSVTSLEGYTATIDYLRKEVYTLIPRILNRTTIPGYNLIFTIFNLNGYVYPTTYNSGTGYLTVVEDWLTSSESTEAYNILDAGGANILFYIYDKFGSELLTFDSGKTFDEYTPVYDNPAYSTLTDTTLDTSVFPTLDMVSILDNLTRHLVIKYSFIYVEDAVQFLSDDTLLALYTDVQNNKRRTELPYYEPTITVNTTDDGVLTSETVYNYDHSVSTAILSILIGTDLTDAFTIRFGDSAHIVIDGSITDVKHLIESVAVSNCDILFTSAERLEGRKKITQKCKFGNFSEIAILDSLGNCIYYATFPQIRYLSYMYSNVGFNVTLV